MSEKWQRIILRIIISSWVVYAYFTYRAWNAIPDVSTVSAGAVTPAAATKRVMLVSISAVEAIVAAIAMLPRWRRYYPLRAAVVAVALLLVAVVLLPAGLSPVERVYLQWVAFVSILLLNVALVASFLWLLQQHLGQSRG